jgi:hypothetical protein
MKYEGVLPVGKHWLELRLLSKTQYVPTPVHTAKRGVPSQVKSIKSWGTLSLCLICNRKSPLPAAVCIVPRMCDMRKPKMKK